MKVPGMAHSISEKLIRNTVFNAVGSLWGVLISILLTPYIIGHVGVARYGILTLVSVTTAYFGLLDFGFSTSFVKFISEFYAREERKRLNQVIVTGASFYLAFALLLIAVGFLCAGPLVAALKVGAQFRGEALGVFYIGVATFAVTCLFIPFSAVAGGLQRMDVSNKLSILLSFINAAGTVAVLRAGYGLPGLMLNGLAVAVLTGAANMFVAFRLLPWLSMSPSLFDSGVFRKLFGFGIKLQVSTLANMLHFQVDKLLLAYLLDVQLVTYYNVASQLAAKLRDMPLLLLSAVFPAASELGARTDSERLEKLYFRSMRYVVLAGLPVFAAGLIFSGTFVRLWLGGGYERTVYTFQVFILAYFLNVMSGPGFTILNGIGMPKYGMFSSMLAAGLNLVLSVVLVLTEGYYGVVWGTSISMIAGASFFIYEFHRVMKISFWHIAARSMGRPLLAVLPVALAAVIGVRALPQMGWITLGCLASAFFAAFAALALALRCFDDFDRALIKDCLARARRRLGYAEWGVLP